ncbi:TPA: NAD-dependent epimerase/dehydratase family protein, partial [Citrobacter koseri]|nr:NAD-dependent epimerase/dehydratase family protein [Citrobacter koseri]
FITIDLLEPINILKKIDFIVHAASITASKEMVENPTGVLLTAFDSTKNILNYVKVNPNCKMVYISSMEYYGQVTEGYENATEDKLGYIDLSKPRSCYPESKRACETLCNAYATQYNINVCSARLAQTFGAGVPFSDNRVFAQFAKSAMNNSDIILHTTGESEGNYCYTADAIYAILLLLTNGKKGQSYNVACDHSSIINMAKLVAEKIADNRIKVDIQIPQDLNNYGYAPTVKLRLNSDKLRALGWEPSTDLEHMFKRMISSWEISIDK